MRDFDRSKLNLQPLDRRRNQFLIEEIAVDLDKVPNIRGKRAREKIKRTALAMKRAKKRGKPIVIGYGAHLIKNGLGPALRWMVQNGYATHLATNGAGSIHDWEFAFQGASSEYVREGLPNGTFGLWKEPGRFMNLALIVGASQGRGYGESICKMVQSNGIWVPDREKIRKRLLSQLKDNKPSKNFTGAANLWQEFCQVWEKYGIGAGKNKVNHRFKEYSVQECVFRKNTATYTVHPGIGYDIIHMAPECSGYAVGGTGYRDFLRFAEIMKHLEGGVLLSIGSAVALPMITEKAMAMARNVVMGNGGKLDNFLIGVDDIQDAGRWEFGIKKDPPMSSPAYFLRLAKSYDRVEAKNMYYIKMDNRAFLLNLINYLN